MRYIMRIFLLLILVSLTLGAVFVSFSNPNVEQKLVNKDIPHDEIEIDD